MLKWLKDLIGLKRRFDELQKAHDLRAVLNSRLSHENARLKKDMHKLGFKKSGGKAQKHIDEMAAARANDKALAHIRCQRYEVRIKTLQALVPVDLAREVQRQVDEMTDQQILAWKKPKATSNSN